MRRDYKLFWLAESREFISRRPNTGWGRCVRLRFKVPGGGDAELMRRLRAN